jgi:predicted RNase H-like HicB family nuclease
MSSITFTIAQEDSGFVAHWDDPSGGGISTEGDSLSDLQQNLIEAVACHFGDESKPDRILLHFLTDIALVPA